MADEKREPPLTDDEIRWFRAEKKWKESTRLVRRAWGEFLTRVAGYVTAFVVLLAFFRDEILRALGLKD